MKPTTLNSDGPGIAPKRTLKVDRGVWPYFWIVLAGHAVVTVFLHGYSLWCGLHLEFDNLARAQSVVLIIGGGTVGMYFLFRFLDRTFARLDRWLGI